jgi:hypothetical protein
LDTLRLDLSTRREKTALPLGVGNPHATVLERDRFHRVRAIWPWYLLLVVPFVGTLWVPFYNAVDPKVAGVPYFYWYQFLWIAISVTLTTVVYFATRAGDP